MQKGRREAGSMKGLVAKTLAMIVLLLAPFTLVSNAEYVDKENSTGNTFSATSLDFELRDFGNNLINSPFFNNQKLKSDEEVERVVIVVKNGGLSFYYWPEFEFKNGNEDVCSAVNLVAEVDGNEVYDGLLTEFNLSSNSAKLTGSEDIWSFTLKNENTDTAFQGEKCGFDLKFRAYQNNLSTGFSDVETLSNEVTFPFEPTISLTHDTINYKLFINLGNLTNFQLYNFELDYDTDTISDHADGDETLSGESTKTIGIDLGIESDGVLVPHYNPHNFKLNIEFTDINSDTVSYLEEL